MGRICNTEIGKMPEKYKQKLVITLGCVVAFWFSIKYEGKEPYKMIVAKLKNGTYQDDYSVDISFPIDEETMMEQLNRINISDYNIAQCYVEKISGNILALRVLENKCINADEMNYLARRIDSFERYERDKFQGAVARDGIQDMKALINLTFNLHNYTIVTEFSDFKRIGWLYYRDKNMGCVADITKGLDFEAIGKDLLSNGDGRVTLYGVVFCNGLPIEEVYDGNMFPDYDYSSDYVVKLEVTKKDSLLPEPPKVWLYLPASKACILKALLRLGADTYNDLSFHCVDTISLSKSFLKKLSATDNIGTLNDLAYLLRILPHEEIEKFEAVVDYTGVKAVNEMIELAKNLDQFFFAPDISNAEQYGRHMILETNRFVEYDMKAGQIEFDRKLEPYIEFERYGQDRLKGEQGCFTSYGYICRTDVMEESKKQAEESTQTMGGM